VTAQTCSVPEAAQLLGVSRAEAYASIRRGDFPVQVIRVGRSIRVPTAPLMRLLDPVEGELQSMLRGRSP
jgi:excisionase family DNA binding protein